MRDRDLDTVTADDITGIARAVWSVLLGLELEPVDEGAARGPAGAGLRGVVGISGAWQGSVAVECSAALARAAAEAMFAAEPGSLSADEVADAVGELTNMVGGTIKSLLPAPSVLSVPSVTAASPDEEPRARPARRVDLVPVPTPHAAATVRITVWKA